MKAPFSAWLQALIPDLQKLRAILRQDYDYVSILSTDSPGLAVRISQHARSIAHRTMTTERGTVIRVAKGGLYAEYAFNDPAGRTPEEIAAEARTELSAQLALLKAVNADVYDTPVLTEEPWEVFTEKETGQLPEEADLAALVAQFAGLSDRGKALSEDHLDCMVTGQSTHISKVFLSDEKFLRQSYVYSEGSVGIIAMRDGANKYGYQSLSGLGGPELFAGLEECLDKAAAQVQTLLSAERMVPGEYDVITSPEVTGLIAHEAFGHGVEMDMFVKNRAMGKDYIGKRVGSDLVTMHEGALCADNVTSYVFDDEGTPAGDVTEIKNGILQTGICDALSALRLGIAPTGNGKRENFEHKAYTRMTNTLFDSGTDSLDDMIASIGYGFLLEGMESGMEDPKHWGIQCIVQMGREIKDGKLTGRVFAPVIMTGYVPDLLGSISMASPHREVFGAGGCGKGYKEWVKVSDGGPYLKTKARLG